MKKLLISSTVLGLISLSSFALANATLNGKDAVSLGSIKNVPYRLVQNDQSNGTQDQSDSSGSSTDQGTDSGDSQDQSTDSNGDDQSDSDSDSNSDYD